MFAPWRFLKSLRIHKDSITGNSFIDILIWEQEWKVKTALSIYKEVHHVSKFSTFRATRARVHLIQLNLSKWNSHIKATAKVFIKTADRRQDTSPEDSLWWVAHNVPSQASRTTKNQTRKKHVEWLFLLLFCWKLRLRLQNDRHILKRSSIFTVTPNIYSTAG